MEPGVALDDPRGSLPTQDILQFYTEMLGLFQIFLKNNRALMHCSSCDIDMCPDLDAHLSCVTVYFLTEHQCKGQDRGDYEGNVALQFKADKTYNQEKLASNLLILINKNPSLSYTHSCGYLSFN